MRWSRTHSVDGEWVARFGQFTCRVYTLPDDGRWRVAFECPSAVLPYTYKDVRPAMRVAYRLARLMIWEALQELEEQPDPDAPKT